MDSNMRDQRVSDLRYTITWRNPYKPRPAGLPKILCSSPFEEELTLPWIIASNWGLSAWAIGIYFEHPKPKRKMDEEKRAAMRKKRMHTRIEKTAPLFADEFEKKELEKRADYFAGKSQVDEAELNKRMDEFSGLMTPGEAIKYMLKLGVPTELSEEDKKLVEEVKRFRANEMKFSSEEFRLRCQKRAAEKAERERKALEALMDIRNEPLFAGLWRM